MCGILLTSLNITPYDINFILEFLKNRGPDVTTIKHIGKYTFVHTLLSMTGPPIEQPFYSANQKIICVYNGEIYNFRDFGEYQSDGQCLIPLYEQYGINFTEKLDGEFAIILLDLSQNKLIISTDIFWN